MKKRNISLVPKKIKKTFDVDIDDKNVDNILEEIKKLREENTKKRFTK